MKFQQMVEEIITETTVAGGAGSALGPGVQSTATPFSGDNYAPGDARTPKSLYGGVMTRKGLKSKKKNKKK
jgi:hypothetical protein